MAAVAYAPSQSTLIAPDAPLLTAEEYYATCKFDQTELIDGKIVELMPPGFDHGEIAGNIYLLLKAFVRRNSLGRVSVEGGFRLSRRPDTVRSPDVSFVEAARLEGVSTRAFIEGAPTLAVEVNSPGDEWSEVEDKVRLYFAAGTRAVWIADPATRTITVRTPDAAPVVYEHQSTLSGAPVLPGFEMPLSEVFEQ